MKTSRRTQKRNGFFVAFEGGEGAGKSTQIELLSEALTDWGYPVTVTREPGGTELGRQIRRLLLLPEDHHVAPRAELLLYMADRAQHVEELIRPHLEAGKIMLTDRFADSSVVYQGICRKLGTTEVKRLNRFATEGLKPDVVFLLDLPVSESQKRLISRALDRMEKESLAFHEKVRKGFLRLARQEKSRFVILDARNEKATLAQTIREEVKRRLKRRGLWKTY